MTSKLIGLDIQKLINKFDISKKQFSELLDVSNMTIMRWMDDANKEIPEKYLNMIEERISQIEKIKKINPEFSYSKIVRQIIKEGAIERPRRTSRSSEVMTLAILVQNPKMIDRNFEVIEEAYKTPFSTIDILGKIKETLVPVEIKADVVQDNNVIFKMLATIEYLKIKFPDTKELKGIIIALGFAENVKETARHFTNIELKSFQINFKDE